MGTNFYVEKNKCECCNRSDREYHIGKSSHGWCFSFQAYTWNSLTSWKAWKAFLVDQVIVDEYGEKISYDEFVSMVEGYKSPAENKMHHNIEARKVGYFNSEYDWDDSDGYPFTTREFS
jgi:hypothetical protein